MLPVPRGSGLRWPVLSRALTTAVLLVALGACAGHEAWSEDAPSLRMLTTQFPGAASLIERAADSTAELTPEGYRLSTRLFIPPAEGKWSVTARGLDVQFSHESPRRFELSIAGLAGRVKVTRSSGSGWRSADAAELTATERAVIARSDAGLEAFFFATDRGIEELVLAKDPSPTLRYHFELPRGWRLRRAKGHRPIVEILEPGDIPWARMVVDQAWDAAEQELTPELAVDGNHVHIALPDDALAPVLIDPEWQEAGAASVSRNGGTATLLQNGRVLLTGGMQGSSRHSSAELFDPQTGRFEVTGSMTAPRFQHTATLLRDGTVLIAGGSGLHEELGVPSHRSAETYDPRSGTFTATEPMNEQRADFSATPLQDGRVLVGGGGAMTGASGFPYQSVASAEIFDPDTRRFTRTGSLADARFGHTATLLPDGRVLFAGGISAASPFSKPALASTELYDPATDSVHAADGLAEARAWGAAVLLSEQGPLLVAGGFSGGYAAGNSSAELYELDSETFRSVDAVMSPGRGRLAASLLPNGKVLLAGGTETLTESVSALGLTEALEFDPTSETYGEPQQMPIRAWPALMTLLPNGKVMVVGDANLAALYDPATLEQAGADETMLLGHAEHAAALLPTGEVLVVGTVGDGYAELFAPNGEARRPQGDPVDVRWGGTTITVLQDGRALIVGSGDSLGEIYDPKTEAFLPIAGPEPPRVIHAATLLSDGRVLITGGCQADGEWNERRTLASALLYEPDANRFTEVGSMSTSRRAHTAAALPDGRALVVGGMSTELCGVSMGAAGLATAELFDPATGAFEPVTPGPAISRDSPKATVLQQGQVLITSGQDIPELFDPTTKLFTPYWHEVGVLVDHSATLLPSGKVLLAGGWPGWAHAPTDHVELLDPSVGHVTATVHASHARATHTATLLPDGSVALIGGYEAADLTITASVEIWREGPDAVPGWPPVLEHAPEQATPGTPEELRGSGFTGVSEARGSMWSSPTNYPVAMWMPFVGAPSFGTITDWTDAQATWTVPATAYPGPGLLFVTVNGIRSNGKVVFIAPADAGTPCENDGACASGFCVDDVCCESACDAPCMSCSEQRKGGGDNGVCGPSEATTDPDDDCDAEPAAPCAQTGQCDGAGQCELASEECDGFVCFRETRTCLTECSSNFDCAEDYYCAASGRCEPDQGDHDPGCAPACAVGGNRRSSPWLALLGLAGLLGAAVTRRRQAA